MLLVALFFFCWHYCGRGKEIQRYNSEIAGLDQRLKVVTKGVSEKEYKALLSRIAFANNIIDKKRYNWLALLDKLEQVVPEGVAISSVEPDPATHA